MAKDEVIENFLNKLDGSGSDQEFHAIRQLKKIVGDLLPQLLLEKYRKSRDWGCRCSCVYHSISYSRKVDEAVQLGIEALADRSKAVHYRACMLLAYSLNEKALPALQELELHGRHKESRENAQAAIDAIKNQNTNYFLDKKHTGKVFLEIFNLQD